MNTVYSQIKDSDSNKNLRKENGKLAHRIFKLATYNIRTFNEGKLFQLLNGCDQHKIDAVAIQEHRQKFESELEYIEKETGRLILASSSIKGVGGVL